MFKGNWLSAGAVVLLAGTAGAHLFGDGLKPTAGESVTTGSTYAVTWKEQFNHAKGTNIDLSLDGGVTWKTIEEDFQDVAGTNTFNWPVDEAATEAAKIRICQHDGGVVKACLASEKTNSLTSAPNGNYVLVSDAFTIGGSTGILHSAPAAGFSAAFRPETRNVEVSFDLAEGGNVLLQAFDARGQLIATLLEGRQEAGSHRLSVFSNRLNAAAGIRVFKLRAGDAVLTQKGGPVH